jgi:ribosomal-protein-alanine N-acetyltransferase
MIETERLALIPLTYDQLLKYMLVDTTCLEDELNLRKTSRTISPELKEALENTILPNVADKSKNYLFSTLWTIILKEQNQMVGDICFYGAPNDKGEVEIGYGTYDGYRGNGYMTEAVKGIILWAKTQTDVKSIVASTDMSNIASFTVLEKNSFVKIGIKDTLFSWQLKFS